MVQRNARLSLKAGKSRAAALTITHANAPQVLTSDAPPTLWPCRRIETTTPVREFPSFTADLNALADWLEACGVDTIAMESIGRVLDSIVRASGVTYASETLP